MDRPPLVPKRRKSDPTMVEQAFAFGKHQGINAAHRYAWGHGYDAGWSDAGNRMPYRGLGLDSALSSWERICNKSWGAFNG